MKPWPRTTFGRTALVIAGLLVLAEVAALAVGRAYLVGAGARQMADLLSDYVQTLTAALARLEPVARTAFLADPPPTGIRLRQSDPPGDAPNLYFLRELAGRLRARLPGTVEIRVQRDANAIVWVRAPGPPVLWIGMPLNSLERALPPLLLAALLSIVLLTVVGAYLLVRQINRPLARLATAARQLGAGRAVPPLTPEGPEEIQILTRAFNQSSASLARLDRDRALLLAGISHDVRTPLARLSVALELLDGDEELKAGIREDIAHIDAIIEQFAALARPEWTESRQVGDLNDLIRAVVATAERAGLDVRLHLADLPPLVFQPLALRRALANLLENARRHGRPPVTLSSASENGEVVIRVADGGAGVPESELERLLLPFTRLDQARGTPGTGLGLAIVARIAAAHGGRVVLRNRPVGGLEARVHLPLLRGD